MSSDEDPVQVQNDYTDETESRIGDGTYYSALQRVDPDAPLFIGIMTDEDQIHLYPKNVDLMMKRTTMMDGSSGGTYCSSSCCFSCAA